MRWRPRTQAARTSAVLAILGALLFALNGCFESSTEVDGDVNAAASSAALPTLDDIRAAVSMTDAQANARKDSASRRRGSSSLAEPRSSNASSCTA